MFIRVSHSVFQLSIVAGSFFFLVSFSIQKKSVTDFSVRCRSFVQQLLLSYMFIHSFFSVLFFHLTLSSRRKHSVKQQTEMKRDLALILKMLMHYNAEHGKCVYFDKQRFYSAQVWKLEANETERANVLTKALLLWPSRKQNSFVHLNARGDYFIILTLSVCCWVFFNFRSFLLQFCQFSFVLPIFMCRYICAIWFLYRCRFVLD